MPAKLLQLLLQLPLPLPLPLPLLQILIVICCPFSQRPNAGVAQGAPRHGCRGSRPRPWMADGGGPPEQCRSAGMPSLSEAPNGGAKPFGYFGPGRAGFSKVTRCKSETNSSRDRRNGYVQLQKNSSPDTSPSRASSAPTGYVNAVRENHKKPLPQEWICTPSKKFVARHEAFAGKPRSYRSCVGANR